MRLPLVKQWSRLSPREKRLLFYFLVLAAVAAWFLVPRPWNPTVKIETDHYAISSTATPDQTASMGRAVEALYRAYSELLNQTVHLPPEHPKLKLLLYKDRDEMRRINPQLGWAEAFYRKPYCRAYYSANEINPSHWMLHEAVHQLNTEVANLDLAKWIDEGLAEYLSTSRFADGALKPGTIDPDTYPVWWNAQIARDGNLARDLANGSIIPLRAIITDRGGPRMSSHVNLYYLHWWTLTHFLFEDERHRKNAKLLLARGGSLAAFEELIGPLQTIEPQWYAHVLRIKDALDRPSPEFHATGKLDGRPANP